MIRLLRRTAINLAARLWSDDPETRLVAWATALAVVFCAWVAGTATGAVVSALESRDECARACAPYAPVRAAGACYCDQSIINPAENPDG